MSRPARRIEYCGLSGWWEVQQIREGDRLLSTTGYWRRNVYPMVEVKPPSTGNATPLINAASSLARKTNALATS